MTERPKSGERIQIYLPADLVKRLREIPRYERSAEVAKALRHYWKQTPPPRSEGGRER